MFRLGDTCGIVFPLVTLSSLHVSAAMSVDYGVAQHTIEPRDFVARRHICRMFDHFGVGVVQQVFGSLTVSDTRTHEPQKAGAMCEEGV